MVSPLLPEVSAMDNELIITGAFLGTGLLAYVIIPGLLVMWDRVSTTWRRAKKRSKNTCRGNLPGGTLLFSGTFTTIRGYF